jgi:hypothetical protein
MLSSVAQYCQMLPNDGDGTDLLLCLLMVSSPYPTILPLALWMGEGELAATTFSKYTFFREMGGYVGSATAALWVRIQKSLKNTKWAT